MTGNPDVRISDTAKQNVSLSPREI